MRLPRQIKNSLLLLPLFFAAQKVCAQLMPADDFFNSGAQFYISNNVAAAKQSVESGLRFYPDDAKLKKLEELLKQQQQSQNSQSQQNQQQQNQQSQSQQQKKDQQSQQQKSDSQKNSQDQQKQDAQKQSGQKQDEPQKQPQKSSAQKKDGEKPDDQKGEGQPVKPGQMTPEEAKRLLDAQKGDEQLLQLKPKDKPEQNQRLVKDW
jgi:Ca-activated chloride channel family protein